MLQKVVITRVTYSDGGGGVGGAGGGEKGSDVYSFFFRHAAVLEMSHFAPNVLLFCMI